MTDLNTVFEAISLCQTQYDQVDKIWNYFSVVTLAVIGFIVGSDKAIRTIKEPIAIIGAYLVFCYGNHKALINGQMKLDELSTMAINIAEKHNIPIPSFKPDPDGAALQTHINFIIAVSIGTLAVAYLRKKNNKDNLN